MKQLEEIREGITILQKYGADHLEPDHDQILIYGAKNVSEYDTMRLAYLKFHLFEGNDGAWLKFT